MIYGTPRPVTDQEEKLAGLRSLAEHIVPGQWDYARRPNKKELAKTSLLACRRSTVAGADGPGRPVP